MDIELKCPHCDEYFIVNKNEINCGIFRHAVFKNNQQPVNPHESKIKCIELVENNLVYGCCKPFKITPDLKTEICDYI